MKLTASVLVNNDTSTSQKTNATFADGYDLATKRAEGKLVFLDGTSGKWVTGGWGASTWTADHNGTLTLPASTTFEHFFSCTLADLYYFYSTSDSTLYRRGFTASDFAAANTQVVSASTHAACVGTSKHLIFMYNGLGGSAKLFSNTTELKAWANGQWGTWTHVVALRNGTTLFYSSSSGAGVVGQFTSTTPYFTELGSFASGTFPSGSDVVTAL